MSLNVDLSILALVKTSERSRILIQAPKFLSMPQDLHPSPRFLIQAPECLSKPREFVSKKANAGFASVGGPHVPLSLVQNSLNVEEVGDYRKDGLFRVFFYDFHQNTISEGPT